MLTKNILIVSTVPFDSSGIITVIMNYYRFMDRSNLKFHFITPKIYQDKYIKEIRSNGDEITEIGSRKNVLRYIMRLNKYIKKNKIDIIHVHGNSSTMSIELLISKLNKIKIRIAHSHNSTSKYKIAHYLLKPLFNRFFNIALACSEDAGRWVFGRKKFTVLNNGIDLAKYKFSQEDRQTVRESYKISQNDVVLLHVGLFNYQKNQYYILNILSSMNKKIDYKMIFVGEGPDYEKTKSKVIELELQNRVIFVGRHYDISKYYSAADIFLLPSRFEGFPLVLIEAQANGLKCLVSNLVTLKANLTGDLTYLPIDKNYDLWIDQFHKSQSDRFQKSSINQIAIRNEGYEISDISSKLRNIYNGVND
ncbi:glycosyltransferase [Acholeplasma laidlawii]|uniref:glycosyltransferase n=1 Tax=Acholeplasma laidlawii TaxID=2148 RepID=UPI00254113A8|nr:glycosyltransferase [Acholeplasma laidlawii]